MTEQKPDFLTTLLALIMSVTNHEKLSKMSDKELKKFLKSEYKKSAKVQQRLNAIYDELIEEGISKKRAENEK